MNKLSISTKKLANDAAIFNIYLYLAHLYSPSQNESFESIINSLANSYFNSKHVELSKRDLYRLNILKNVIANNDYIGKAKLINLTNSKSGLTACVFLMPDNKIHLAFKGTGSGEWIDNGEGLAGTKISTNQQMEALIWFYRIIKKNGWTNNDSIILSGHSKGGNKAQFITMHSDLPDICFSFSGQGFSPEALSSFRNILGTNFIERRNKIYSFSADNDYVNVLGMRLTPNNNCYYFEPTFGLHGLESILNPDGFFTEQRNQGKLSRYVEEISLDVMRIKPFARQYATIGIMNIFQKYLGDGTPLKGDEISLEHTILGVSQLVRALLSNIIKN